MATFMDGDAELVARVRSGDRDSFDELYDTYADDVFSMCLLILGDPAVARAAAGTAFALVARTRLNPLTDPERLRSWLLELARGSALAWSGSPQARSVPVPHGVSAEEMIDGAVVPAPASLRVGLARTFDRATVAAADRQPAHLGLRKVSSPETDLHDAPTEIGRGDRPRRQPEPVLVEVGDRRSTDGIDPATIVPFPRTAGDASPAEWRARPAIAVAAALVLAVAGVTTAVSWPTSSNSISAETLQGAAVVSSSAAAAGPADVPKGPKAGEAPSSTLEPTVAGVFTSVPSAQRPAGTRPAPAPTVTTQRVVPAPAPPPPPTTVTPSNTPTPNNPTTEPAPTTTEPSEIPTLGPSPTDAPAPTPTDPTGGPITGGPTTGGPITGGPTTGGPATEVPTSEQPGNSPPGSGTPVVGTIEVTVPVII